ncbi:hypothetical protein OH76DRAFT_619894 [Lentinus brumalis]|uniref:Uncharacterized protein n=1 Tax=Lentinus brumalis TaxID=2498619 RepID=A0A371D903_9APHY|nr:hypothetical protein OH76DRAFT_619894 [Polyporus brumalis]
MRELVSSRDPSCPFRRAHIALDSVAQELDGFDGVDAEQKYDVSLSCVPSTQDSESLRNLDLALRTCSPLVRRAINASATVNRLPPKLLVAIFLLVPGTLAAEDIFCYPARPMSSGPFPMVRHLLPLIAVCHRWRDIAVATPSLWSTIHDQRRYDPSTGLRVKSISMLNNAFLRCPSGPIRIFLDHGASSQTCASMRSESFRITELWVNAGTSESIYGGPHCDILQALCLADLNNVKYCVLANYRYSSSLFERRTEHPSSGPISRLRHLCPHNSVIKPSMDMPSLTHLAISSFPVRIWSSTIDVLLRLLSRCPRLRELHLTALFRRFKWAYTELYSPLDHGIGQKVRLPLLETLVIDEPVFDYISVRPYHPEPDAQAAVKGLAMALIPHLSLPNDCEVDVGELFPPFALPFVTALAAARETQVDTEETMLYIVSDRVGRRGQRQERHHIAAINADREDGNILRVGVRRRAWRHKKPDEEDIRIWDHIGPLLSVPMFRLVRFLVLEISGRVYWPHDMSKAVFSSLPLLEAVFLDSLPPFPVAQRASSVLHALFPPKDEYDRLGAGLDVCCPGLVFALVSCRPNEVPVMLEAVRARAAAGHAVTRLLLDVLWRRNRPREMRMYDGEGVLVKVLMEDEANEFRDRPKMAGLGTPCARWDDSSDDECDSTM